MRHLLILLCVGLGLNTRGQVPETFVEGKVYVNDGQSKTALVGAHVYWQNTSKGTVTNDTGYFSIAMVPDSRKLIVAFIGMESDTLSVVEPGYHEVILESDKTLDEVEVVSRQKTTEVALFNPIKVEQISEGELEKAACCNLSESFETIPSVDVGFSDAVTGTRQITMLGLTSPNIQITRENIPNIRGLSSLYGLTYVPGAWVEGMQLNKGAGSVVNGYESIAGQINVEMRKPETADPLYLNLYVNEGGRTEANVVAAKRWNKWSTALFLHGKQNQLKHDRNTDGFLDMPLSKHFIAMNRWKYASDGPWRIQLGTKATLLDNKGGEMDFDFDRPDDNGQGWGMRMETKRYEAWMKAGRLFEHIPWRSVGFQAAASLQNINSYFGQRNYVAEQKSLYFNSIFQDILGNTNHPFKAGLSFQYDQVDEQLVNQNFAWTEWVPGAYFEYQNKVSEAWDLVAGLRGDYHNLYGFFVTPRIHLRYSPNARSAFRLSAGRGQRTPYALAENNGVLASNRQVIFEGSQGNTPYGLEAESAWNMGLNYTFKFLLGQGNSTLSFDVYRSQFENQLVMNLDRSAQQVIFSNLEGRSFANSFQMQWDFSPLKNFDVRWAYRFFDVKTTLDGDLLPKALLAQHRSFINLAYAWGNGWLADWTYNLQGPKRLPSTNNSPEAFQLEEYSPWFGLMNAQITKQFQSGLELYLGIENALNFRQDQVILSSENPSGPYFDASMIWGPVFGRNTYFGLRYRLK